MRGLSPGLFIVYAAATTRDQARIVDMEWRIFDPLLPDRGERGPPIKDKRRTVNGILWVLRTRAPWRDMPERYGFIGQDFRIDHLRGEIPMKG